MGYDADGKWDWGSQAEAERKQAIKDRNERLTKEENERIAKVKSESARRSKMSNGVMLLHEYRRAGVEPIELDEDGHPKVSLSTMLYVGWEIVDGEHGKILVKPKKTKNITRSVG